MEKLVTTVGQDIRSIRNIRGFSLAHLASKLNRSVGWLSQIERGLSQPTDEDIRAISHELDVPVALLFNNAPGPELERGYVVRKENRREVIPFKGLSEQLLSPDLTDAFEVVRSVHEPGAKIPETAMRNTHEVVYLISGKLDLVIAGREFKVAAGDSFRIRAEAFHWSNPYSEPAVAIWIVSPPVY